MTDITSTAIQLTLHGRHTFCKFLSANDTGLTGGHQAGIYIPKDSASILFGFHPQKGENREHWAKLKWQNDFETTSRFVYYGKGTRDENRITNFGRGFPYLRPEYTGALFILVQEENDFYHGFILNSEDEINRFLDTFGMGPTDTNRLISTQIADYKTLEKLTIENFIASLKVDFPSSETMSLTARQIQDQIYNHEDFIISNPDRKLVEWINLEYRLFQLLERSRYGNLLSSGFTNIDDFIAVANQVLNRRKSRAGKSLEHHLAAIFDGNYLQYTAQAITEGNKSPDFIFPSQEAYRNYNFPTDQIISLAAKTTCKDRWRQIINESDRLKGKKKYLCTLQQGISVTQMNEMESEKIILVVPEVYIMSYPKEKRGGIWTLKKFIQYAKEVESL